MIMGNFKKVYVGAIESEQEAAYLYDKIAVILHGLKVTYFIDWLFNRLKQISTTQSVTS